MTYGLKLITGLTALSLLGACASQRGPQGRGGPPPGEQGQMRSELQGGLIAQPVAFLFIESDANRDTILTRGELDTATQTLWQSLQPGESGTIGAIAYGRWAEPHLGAEDALPNRISFDTNLDGAISEPEFAEGLVREFSRLDKNEDGELTRAELLVRIPERQMQPGGNRGGAGGPGGRGGDRPPPGGRG